MSRIPCAFYGPADCFRFVAGFASSWIGGAQERERERDKQTARPRDMQEPSMRHKQESYA